MSILERSYCYNTYQCIDWIKEQDPTIIVHDVYSNVAHNLTPDEVEEIFKDKPKFLKKEKGKVEGEYLYNALGQTESGRYLTVFFIYKYS